MLQLFCFLLVSIAFGTSEFCDLKGYTKLASIIRIVLMTVLCIGGIYGISQTV